MSERLQQRPVHRRAAAIVHADDAAHSMRVSMERIGFSKGTKWRCSALASFNTWESTSTQACASKRSESLRAPMRRSASIPRRRNSHHSTSDCSRQFGVEEKIPRCRRFHPRDQESGLLLRCPCAARLRSRAAQTPPARAPSGESRSGANPPRSRATRPSLRGRCRARKRSAAEIFCNARS